MKKPLVGLGLSFVLLLLLAPAALAGGWAVSTIDPMATPTAGAPIDVGFTIRQHGMTPVDLADVAIAVTGPSGETTVFPAQRDGDIGHYVTFAEGQSTWEIRQGFFEPQDLGTITVASDAPSPSVVESSSYRWPGLARGLVPLAAVALATIAITDAIVSRRRKPSDA